MQNYAREKLMSAVSSLATNARPLNQRLLSAFNSVIRLDDSTLQVKKLKNGDIYVMQFLDKTKVLILRFTRKQGLCTIISIGLMRRSKKIW